MASYLLYIITGAVLALMSARRLLALRHTLPKHRDGRRDILHAVEGKGLEWAETALCGGIFLFGLWMVLAAGLLFTASLLHSL